MCSKRQREKIMAQPLSGDGKIVMDDKEKAEVLYFYFILVFSQKTAYDAPVKCEVQRGQDWRLRLINSQGLSYYCILNGLKSPGPDELHPRVLKKLAEEISEPLSIIFLKSLRMGEAPCNWRRANIVPIRAKRMNQGTTDWSSWHQSQGKLWRRL